MRTVPFIFLLILAICVDCYSQSSEPVCPKLNVIAPAGMMAAGDQIPFSLEIEGDVDFSKVGIEWTVGDGSIVEGQGTRKIRVAHGGRAKFLNAVVAVTGLPFGCLSEASDYAAVAYPDCGPPSDDFGEIPLNDELVRLDMFFGGIDERAEVDRVHPPRIRRGQ